jgi:hypothetical protein
MDMMNYDAGTIGDNEFSFGKDFFLKNINDTNLTFLSCNISGSQQLAAIKSIKPYIVKEVSGIKIGIIGVTNLAANTKSGELKFSEPTPSVAKYVTELKNNGVNIIVLVSQLEESEDLNLINQIKGIDILMGSRHPARDKSYVKLENTLILKPFWQGRSLGKVTLTVENNKIISFKVEAFRLSDQISDDADILTILPRCFSDANCKREGVVGACQQPGTLNASCLFSKPTKIDTLVITSKTCITCNTATAVNFLKNKLPGLNLIYLYYPEKKAADLLKSLGISGLPAYLLSKEIEKEKNFDSLRLNLEQKGNFYLVKPQVSGISYFFNRNKTKGSLDLFISLYDKNSSALLDVIKEFKPAIHFLASEKEGKFDAMKEEPEVEEYLRAVCVQKYYPEKFWDYIYCRTKDIFSSWWDECALDLDTNKIKSCAKGTEGISLLRENITINKELDIILGPTYLLDNQEIFGSNGVPTKEELKAIIKR